MVRAASAKVIHIATRGNYLPQRERKMKKKARKVKKLYFTRELLKTVTDPKYFCCLPSQNKDFGNSCMLLQAL
jgi:hypothetical protein